VTASLAYSCGIDWAVPKSHFEGVSSQGYVFLVKELGSIKLASGTDLPLRAIFRSESNLSSPFIGHGWEIPLLESRVVQKNERFFRVVEPSGWFRLFWRDDKDPSILHGQGNWKGIVRDQSISLIADCGSRLEYQEGKLVSMQIKDEKLQIIRSPDGTARIQQGASTLLSIGPGTSNKQVELTLGIAFKRKLILTERPLVELVDNKAFIGKQALSLGGADLPDGNRVDFTYGVDESLNPTLTFGKHFLSWNPAPRLILADETWKYDVKSFPKTETVAIERRDSKGKSEFWHLDQSKGTETKRDVSGKETITTSFVSGKLAGKVRKREEVVNGVNKVVYQARYNEQGIRFQEIINGGTLDLHYNDKGRLTKKTDSSGKTVWEIAINDSGHLIRKIVNGNRFDYDYKSDGSYVRLKKDPKTGAILQQSVFDKDGRNTAFTNEKGEFYQFFYRKDGQLEKTFRNHALYNAFIFDEESGIKLKEVIFRSGSVKIDHVRILSGDSMGKTLPESKISPEETANLLAKIIAN